MTRQVLTPLEPRVENGARLPGDGPPKESEAVTKPVEPPADDAPRLGEELAKIPVEPFLAVEAKLIAWSLALGVVLLGVLIWISSTFFPR